MTDDMTSRERFINALEMKEVDIFWESMISCFEQED